jgi:hypothetical protein
MGPGLTAASSAMRRPCLPAAQATAQAFWLRVGGAGRAAAAEKSGPGRVLGPGNDPGAREASAP